MALIKPEQLRSGSYNITGSLFGTASYATQALTASFALNGGGGTTFPFSGSAVITGSFNQASSSLASGLFAHAQGFAVTASGIYSHAEGQSTTATGQNSHAEGYLTTATGYASHAEGEGTLANGFASHAEGVSTFASGDYSHAEGLATVALGLYQHVQGQYNLSSSAQSAFIVGNGTGLGALRSNLIFASGSQVQITGSVIATAGFTGSLQGTATTASYLNTLNQNLTLNGTASISYLNVSYESASVIYSSGSNQFGDAVNDTQTLYGSVIVPTGSLTVTGSLRGQVSALSIASNTASLNMSTNNFFTLVLVNGTNTNINPTNINPGQTVNILVSQSSAGTGTVSFPSIVKQLTGSLYTGSAVANAVDIVTMITFDTSTVYVSSIRNLV